MKKNSLVRAVALVLGGNSFLAATQHANADDVVALRMEKPMPSQVARPSTMVQKQLDAEALLARGLARLSTAKNPADYRLAYDYFRLAARQGNTEAQFQLAIMQLDNPYIDQDEAAAIRWLEAASEHGHRQAAIALEYVVNSGGDIGC
jgi:TPR repeat protein